MNITYTRFQNVFRRELAYGQYDYLFSNGLIIGIGCVILIANAIALIIFSRKTLRSKRSSLLLVNMTIADILVGLSVMLLCVAIIGAFIKVSKSHTFLLVQMFLFQLSVAASIISLSAISIERFVAVFWPLYHRLGRKRHYCLAIVSIWLLALCNPLIYHLYIRNILSKTTMTAVICSILTVYLITIPLSYLSIWIKMKYFTAIQHSRTMQENKKLTQTLFIVTVVSLITWSPFNITKIYHVNIFVKDLDLVFRVMLLSNSFLNVIVYSWRIPEFKKELKKLFCFCNLNNGDEMDSQNTQRLGQVVIARHNQSSLVIPMESLQENRIE